VWIPQRASSDPRHKSDDHENADSADGSEGAGHSDPHDDLKEAEVFGHAGGRISVVSRPTCSERRGSEAILVSM
jgi:hypothetical protein